MTLMCVGFYTPKWNSFQSRRTTQVQCRTRVACASAACLRKTFLKCEHYKEMTRLRRSSKNGEIAAISARPDPTRDSETPWLRQVALVPAL
jgi:hypothetical protein